MSFFKNAFNKKSGKAEKIDLTKRFELIGRVGQGSMSQVWRARDTITGQQVALKILDTAKTQRLEARFVGMNKPSEGEMAVLLQHPYIVRTLEQGISTKKEWFLVMEFLEGVGLSFLVDMQNKTMQKHRLRLMIELGEAIQYIHEAGFIHRDICPRNVLVDEKKTIKLIDFGLMVPNMPDFRKPGNRTGTANYMAPELIRRQPTDQRLDIFSYAVTCYEMFCNRHPWDATSQVDTLESVMQRINTPANDLRTVAKEVDEEVAEIIMKGLEVLPQDRWQTIAEMTWELKKARSRIEGIPLEDDDYEEVTELVEEEEEEEFYLKTDNRRVTDDDDDDDEFEDVTEFEEIDDDDDFEDVTEFEEYKD